MKAKERNTGFRKHSDENIPISDLWYFSDPTEQHSPAQKKESETYDPSRKVIRGRTDHLISRTPERKRNRKTLYSEIFFSCYCSTEMKK